MPRATEFGLRTAGTLGVSACDDDDEAQQGHASKYQPLSNGSMSVVPPPVPLGWLQSA